MFIHHSFDDRYIGLLERLRKKYGASMLNLTGIGDDDLDINKYSKKFFDSKGTLADKTIDGNANAADKSVLSWETESAKPLKKLNGFYIIWKEAQRKFGIKKANKMIEAEIRGAIRIHDSSMVNKPYCWASSLERLCNVGMPFYQKIKIEKPKHFKSYCNLSLQYISFISNQIAGAVALPDFFVYMDYYVRKDFGELWYENEDTLREIRQEFQSWIYSVNFPWRSSQSPFTNISIFDKFWLESLFKNYVHPDMSKPDFGNVDKLQRLFSEEMVSQLEDNPFTFPVMTAAFLTSPDTNEVLDEEFLDFVSELNTKTGLFNIYIDSDTANLSSCCRLRSNIEEANKEYINSFGTGGVSIGSHRVVTVNLPQIAYETQGSWDDFWKLLRKRIDLSQDILDIHRDIIQKMIDGGNLPLYTHGFMDLSRQFSTLGFIGINECLELLGFDILDNAGKEMVSEIIETFNEMNLKRSKLDGMIRNVEQIPGESAASNLADKDKLLFQDAKYDLYSNQYIPLTKQADITERIQAQGRFDSAVGGGSILHLNCENELTKRQMKKLIVHTAKQGVVYFAVNYNFSQCENCGKVYVGKYDKSPCHQADMKKFLRVVGFLTEVSDWSEPRRKEYEQRQFYENT